MSRLWSPVARLSRLHQRKPSAPSGPSECCKGLLFHSFAFTSRRVIRQVMSRKGSSKRSAARASKQLAFLSAADAGRPARI